MYQFLLLVDLDCKMTLAVFVIILIALPPPGSEPTEGIWRC